MIDEKIIPDFKGLFRGIERVRVDRPLLRIPGRYTLEVVALWCDPSKTKRGVWTFGADFKVQAFSRAHTDVGFPLGTQFRWLCNIHGKNDEKALSRIRGLFAAFGDEWCPLQVSSRVVRWSVGPDQPARGLWVGASIVWIGKRGKGFPRPTWIPLERGEFFNGSDPFDKGRKRYLKKQKQQLQERKRAQKSARPGGPRSRIKNPGMAGPHTGCPTRKTKRKIQRNGSGSAQTPGIRTPGNNSEQQTHDHQSGTIHRHHSSR